MEKTFEEALNFRHACKIFDENKKISSEDLKYILEAGRKSPSSFGQEPWKFLVITNQELKEKLRPACWNQVQITSCSHLVVILAAIDDARPSSGTPEKKFARRGLPKEQYLAYMDKYADHLQKTLSSDENIFSWTARQTYIALGNMMSAAAIKGIDSCAIEGMEVNDVEKILSLDTSKYRVSVLLPLGYRVNPQSKQLREELESIVEYID